MKVLACSSVSAFTFFLVISTISSSVGAESCNLAAVRGSQILFCENATPKLTLNSCEEGKMYTTYNCSPSVGLLTKVVLTLNSFEEGRDSGAPSECDKNYHSDDTPVLALSTGWFNDKSRCLKSITIYGNGLSVRAMVVDECDSTKGCDDDHDYQPLCRNNIVDASKALGVATEDWGNLDIFWSD